MANSATTHVGGAEGFAAKTLGFALKKLLLSWTISSSPTLAMEAK